MSMPDPNVTRPESSGVPGAAGYAQSHRILMGTLMAAPVVIGISLAAVFYPMTMPLPGQEVPGLFAAPNRAVAVIQLLLAVALHAAITAIGYRVKPIDPKLDAAAQRQQGLMAFQSAAILRFALAEVLIIGSVAAAFVVSAGGFLTYVLGAVLGLVLLYLHIWPAPRNLAPVAEHLDADGARSGLLEEFGFEAGRL